MLPRHSGVTDAPSRTDSGFSTVGLEMDLCGVRWKQKIGRREKANQTNQSTKKWHAVVASRGE